MREQRGMQKMEKQNIIDLKDIGYAQRLPNQLFAIKMLTNIDVEETQAILRHIRKQRA